MLDRLLQFLETTYHNIETFQKIIELLKKLRKKIFYIILFLYLMICVCRITVIRDYFIETPLKPVVIFLYENGNICLFVLLMILVGIQAYRMWRGAKYTIQQLDTTKVLIEGLHTTLIHDIRDNMRQLDEFAVDVQKSNDEGKTVIKKQLKNSLSDNIQIYVDFLAEHLTKFCQDTITVCIKLVEMSEEEKKIAYTIARSSNTKKNRAKENETIVIDENDDFKYLYDGNNIFFASSDLVSDHNNGKYKVQEAIEIWKNKYTSTLVVPIRYYSMHSRHNQVNLELDILGFLCIDSVASRPEWTKGDSYELSLLAVFADAMYIYIKKFNEIYYDVMYGEKR